MRPGKIALTASQGGANRLTRSAFKEKQPGRPTRLTEKQFSEIKSSIKSELEKNGLIVWDGPSLSRFLKDKYGTVLGATQCQRMFHVY